MIEYICRGCGKTVGLTYSIKSRTKRKLTKRKLWGCCCFELERKNLD